MEKAGKKKKKCAIWSEERGRGGGTVVEIIITKCVTKQTTVTAFHVHAHSFSSTWCAAVAEEETQKMMVPSVLFGVMWRVHCGLSCVDGFLFFFLGLWSEHIAAPVRFLFFLLYRAEAGERKAHSASSLHLYLDVSIRMSDRPLCDFFFFVGGGFSRSSGHNRIEGREGAPAQKNPFKNN